MEPTTGHPCYGCTAIAVDHAIVCPWLGVIAAGKHKRVQSRDSATAYNLLDNSHSNNRQSIRLTSPYWETQTYGKLIPLSADRDGTLVYGAKRREASPRSEKATRAPRRNRATRNAALAARVKELLTDKTARLGLTRRTPHGRYTEAHVPRMGTEGNTQTNPRRQSLRTRMENDAN